MYIVKDNLEVGTITVTEYNISSGKTKDILTTKVAQDYTAKYSAKTGALFVNDYYGRTFKVSAKNQKPTQILKNYIVENYIPTQDGGLIWIDSINKNLYKNNKLLLKNTGAYYNLSMCEGGVVFDNMADDRLSTFNFKTGKVTDLFGADFSVYYPLLSIACTVCILPCLHYNFYAFYTQQGYGIGRSIKIIVC